MAPRSTGGGGLGEAAGGWAGREGEQGKERFCTRARPSGSSESEFRTVSEPESGLPAGRDPDDNGSCAQLESQSQSASEVESGVGVGVCVRVCVI